MRRLNLPVTLSQTPKKGWVNVTHPYDFGLCKRGITPYVLACRGDAHQPALANFWLEQNETRGVSLRHSWVQFWPQPGLIARDHARGLLVENLAYKGDVANLDAQFRSVGFLAALHERGVNFQLDMLDATITSTKNSGTSANWHDYQTTDVILAVRNLTEYDASGKPASKLINSWLAGVPALLGPEPAYRKIRRSPLDYIEVRSPVDVLDAISQLKSAPELYRRMVENGRLRAQEFCIEQTMARWLDVLNGPVRDSFLKWSVSGISKKTAFFVSAVIMEKWMRRAHFRKIHEGKRIL